VDDPAHGQQQVTYWHGDYDQNQDLPLLDTCVNNVSKKELVRTLQVLLRSRRIKIAPSMPFFQASHGRSLIVVSIGRMATDIPLYSYGVRVEGPGPGYQIPMQCLGGRPSEAEAIREVARLLMLNFAHSPASWEAAPILAEQMREAAWELEREGGDRTKL
jgi:hypothetical protein